MSGDPRKNAYAGIVLFPGTDKEFTVREDLPYLISGKKYEFFSSEHGHMVEANDEQVKEALRVRDQSVVDATFEEVHRELPKPVPQSSEGGDIENLE